MLKTIFKILYITLGAVLCFIIYSLTYNVNVSNKVKKTLQEKIDENKTEEVMKLFTMTSLPYDSVPQYEEKLENVGDNVIVYNTISKFSVTTYVNKGTEEKKKWKSTTEERYEYMYYIFIYYPKFNYTSGGEYNYSGLRLNTEDSEVYQDYYYIISDSKKEDNYSLYLEHPTTEFDAIYYSKRNIIENYSDFDLIFIPITESLIYDTEEKLGKSITSISFLAHEKGQSVVKGEMSFKPDFSDNFFTEMTEFKKQINLYKYSSDKDLVNSAEDYLDDFKASEVNPEFHEGYSRSVIYTKSLIWSAIGIVVLFIVVLVLVFILIFHFAFIKSVIFRKPKPKGRYVPNKVEGKDKNENVNKPIKQIEATHEKRKNENVIDAEVKETTKDVSSQNAEAEIKSNDSSENNE